MPIGRWTNWDRAIHEGCDFWDTLDSVDETRLNTIRNRKQDQRTEQRKEFYVQQLLKKKLGESNE